MKTNKRKFQIPHTNVILFFMVATCAILTHIIPAGTYERAENAAGRIAVVPGSYHHVEQAGLSFFDTMKEFMLGMQSASDIIFFIFIFGGALAIIRDTGALDAGVHNLAKKLDKRKNLVLVIFIFLFSILGGTIGMAEDAIVYIPILITLCKQFKMDNMVALAVVMVGSRIGFVSGLMNPFTVGVAHGLAELPMYSGLGYRLIWYVVIFVVTVWYILRYANKIQKDPTLSIMYGEESDENDVPSAFMEITTRQKIILLEFVSPIGIMLFGVFKYGWFMLEIATLFLIFSLLIGITGKISPNAMAKSFVNGAADMTFAALVVGIAKAILLTLQDGVIIDSILYYASNLLNGLPKVVAANGMYVFQCFLNFLIPSGSGQAAATIPIMAPLADSLDITRQVAVLAYHYGDGFTNLICPTLGSLMACIVVSKVPFEKYLKWIMPLCGMWIVIGFLSVSIATIINLGPF